MLSFNKLNQLNVHFKFFMTAIQWFCNIYATHASYFPRLYPLSVKLHYMHTDSIHIKISRRYPVINTQIYSISWFGFPCWQFDSWYHGYFRMCSPNILQHKTKSIIDSWQAKRDVVCYFMKITPLQNLFIAISSRCGDDYTWFDGEDMFTFWQLVSEPISSTDDVVSPPPLVNRSKC